MNELERLKADLEVIERYQTYSILENVRYDLTDKIARLEAEAADPWREAKEFCDDYRGDKERVGIVTAYIDHLTAEVDRLTKRVAELEADKADAEEIEDDYYNVSQAAKDAYEARHQDADPVLEPARVLATAAVIYDKKGLPLSGGMCRKDSGNAQPYRLKGGENEH